MDKLAVLGGSSPFSASLIEALRRASPPLPPLRLVLHGLSAERLELLRAHAAARLEGLGWRVDATADLDRAVEGSRVVIHQIRYGGMRGRAEDEEASLRFGIQPDETLGPSALGSLLRITPGLRSTARALAGGCPEAWVLNLTNPLSAVTSLLAEAGVSRCIGLCELPLFTAMRAAEALGLPLGSVEWSYAGLNHRGFIVALRQGAAELIGELTLRLGDRELEGIPSAEIARLHAVPTKYFRLMTSGSPAARGGRAAQLEALGGRILEELRERPGEVPAGLRERYSEWYPLSVVPTIAALLSDSQSVLVLNLPGADGLVRELHARVSRLGIEPLCEPPLGAAVAAWIERFARHERLVLEAARSPGLAALAQAVEADPLVPAAKAGTVARFLASTHGSAKA